MYKLKYKITTPTGCKVELVDSIRVNVVKPITIQQESGDFCKNGIIQLKAAPGDQGLTYNWYYAKSSGEQLIIIDKVLSGDINAYQQGYYQVKADNSQCSTTSTVVKIGFDDRLTYKLLPAENSKTELCNEDQFMISVESRAETNYLWEYGTSFDGSYQMLSESTSKLLAQGSGFYRVKGRFGFCSFESQPVQVKFSTDSVFVPNVFTPNGDAFNSLFKVETTFQLSQFIIINRQGQHMYSDVSGQWDGGDAPAGVYFWYLKYNGCDNKNIERKGWLNLLR
jgi:hypothetical protein